MLATPTSAAADSWPERSGSDLDYGTGMDRDRGHERPPGWSYNPSAWSQRLPIVALALVAFGMALYMALYQWRVIDTVWDPVFGAGSQRVLDSHESEQMRKWMRIPDSALGAFGYLTEAPAS